MPLYACGSNGAGQLALGHTDDVSSFTRCSFDPICGVADHQPKALVSAASHVLALQCPAVASPMSPAALLGAGTNTHGQLGLQCALHADGEPRKAATSFRPLSLARDAGLDVDKWAPVRIAATWTTSFVVFEQMDPDGSGVSGASLMGRKQVIVAAGSNDFGELGTGTPSAPGVMVVPCVLEEDEWIEHMEAGQRHVVVVITRGKMSDPRQTQRVVGWGAARHGQLSGVPMVPSLKGKGKNRAPTTLPPTPIHLNLPPGVLITKLSLGATHSLALRNDGRVSAWGSDAKGQIAALDEVQGAVSVAATWGGSYVQTETGIWSQGANTHGQLLRAVGGDVETDTKDVDAGPPPPPTPSSIPISIPRSDTRTTTENVVLGRVPLPTVTLATGNKHDSSPLTMVAGSEHLLVVVRMPTEDPWAPQRPFKLLAGGWNEHGNLALGDEIDRNRLTLVNFVVGSPEAQFDQAGVWAGCAATWLWCT